MINIQFGMKNVVWLKGSGGAGDVSKTSTSVSSQFVKGLRGQEGIRE